MNAEYKKQLEEFYSNLSKRELDYMVNRLEKQYQRLKRTYNWTYLKYLIDIVEEMGIADTEKLKREERIIAIKNKRARRFI